MEITGMFLASSHVDCVSNSRSLPKPTNPQRNKNGWNRTFAIMYRPWLPSETAAWARYDASPSTIFSETAFNQTWTSIAVLYNPSMPLHRDMNMIGYAKVESGSKMTTDKQGHCWRRKAVRSCYVERGLTCMTKPFRSMLGNITCLKSIAEICGLLPHIRLKRTNMLMNLTSRN